MSGKIIEVHIEYCSGWGYESKFRDLRDKILASLPSAEVTGEKGRKTSFEVAINGKMMYSKLDSGSFPDFKDIVQVCVEISEGKETSEIKAGQSTCSIS